MKNFILDFFGYFVFFYSLTLIITYTTLMVLSFLSQRREKIFFSVPYIKRMLADSPYTPGISIIAPAYNEEASIIDTVRSMFAVDYPKFEIIIVNDGSTDSTLDKLINAYDLVEVPYAYRELVKSAPVKRIFKSRNKAYYQLMVVDKENGATKADASNAGINAASYPYFIDTDGDCILDKDALYRLIWSVLSNHKRVIAVSAAMMMVQGLKMENGQTVYERVPHSPIPLFQELEYMRSYLVGKMGWAFINAIPNVSGGFGFFDREIVIAVGGYDSKSFAEDMDLTSRMVKYMYESGIPYKITQVPETCCWTEGPSNVFLLGRQRTRWARGLMQWLFVHHKMILNPRYHQVGVLLMPYMTVFEFLAPIIEITGLVFFVWLALTNAINWGTTWAIFLMIYMFCLFLTMVVCFFSYFIGSSYRRYVFAREGYFLLFLASMFEPFIYHPLIMFFSLKGYFSYLTKRNFKWVNMSHKGSGDNKSEDTTTAKATGVATATVSIEKNEI
jgi:cellulose synthase/poly-beta-1,6-N-acetylglucosamine synthase-like glycosyltransferase